MSRRPWSLTFLSLALFGVAISLPIQIMVLFELNPLELDAIFLNMAPLNWAVFFLAISAGFSLLRASAWSWFFCSSLLLVTAANNWVVARTELTFSPENAWMGTVLLLLAHTVMFTENARKALSQPRLRWWLTPARRQVTLRAVVYPTLGGKLESQTFDISEGGAFILLDSAQTEQRAIETSKLLRNLRPGDHCSLQIDLDQFRSLHCVGKVVRRSSEAIGKYPTGVALRFIGLNRNERRLLSDLIYTQLESHPINPLQAA